MGIFGDIGTTLFGSHRNVGTFKSTDSDGMEHDTTMQDWTPGIFEDVYKQTVAVGSDVVDTGEDIYGIFAGETKKETYVDADGMTQTRDVDIPFWSRVGKVGQDLINIGTDALKGVAEVAGSIMECAVNVVSDVVSWVSSW